jgi:hypothetical protein
MDSANNQYLILDHRSTPLAQGVLMGPANASTWQVRVLDDKIDLVKNQAKLQLVSMGGGNDLIGRTIDVRGDCVYLERLRDMGSELRENLRMNTGFESFIYPLTGAWRGRRTIRAQDLSCGGMAFTCKEALSIGERMEVVVPITEEPMILHCEVLRQKADKSGETLYATKFVDMCPDEEMLVRRSVFTLQLRQRRTRV